MIPVSHYVGSDSWFLLSSERFLAPWRRIWRSGGRILGICSVNSSEVQTLLISPRKIQTLVIFKPSRSPGNESYASSTLIYKSNQITFINVSEFTQWMQSKVLHIKTLALKDIEEKYKYSDAQYIRANILLQWRRQVHACFEEPQIQKRTQEMGSDGTLTSKLQLDAAATATLHAPLKVNMWRSEAWNDASKMHWRK